MDTFQFSLPTTIIGGSGVAREAGQELAKLGVRRVFCVTDGVIRRAGLVEPVLAGLAEGGVELAGLFDEVRPNSEVGLVDRGGHLARQARAHGVLAIGGGSVIDTAKGINVVLSYDGSILDYQGYGAIDRPLAPMVAIPTTAGTGSEVTHIAVIKDDAGRAKLSFVSRHLAPSLALLDPDMTATMPAPVTASTGMDALTHAIEAYVSASHNPVADGLALTAMRDIRRWLPLATHRGDSPEARQRMLVAATLAGAAFNSALVGCVHAMAHAAGGLYGIAHGLANSILLPHGMTYNLETCPERFRDIAAALGCRTEGLSDADAARLAVAEARALAAECGLPVRLRDAGIPEEGLPEIAQAAMMDAAMFTNPRQGDTDEILAVLRRAF
ncbi:MAG: iron-containing alcohol dehydrogenase [Bacillota bacterium]